MSTATQLQRGCGKGRNHWRIREFLAGVEDPQGKPLNITSLAALARTRKSTVSDTLKGLRNHRRTLTVLERLGCSRDLLYPLERKERPEGRAA